MKTKIFSMLVLAMLTLTACSNSAPVDVAEVAEVPEVTNNGPAVIADAPEGCPSSTDLTVASDEVGSFSALKSYYVTWGTRLDTPDIFFTNYEDVDPINKYGHKVVGDEALVVIRPSHVDGTEVSLGAFTKVEGDNKKLGEVNISTENLSGGVFDKEATFEFTYIGDKYVCGNIKADDGSSKVVGEFIAERIVN